MGAGGVRGGAEYRAVGQGASLVVASVGSRTHVPLNV